MIPPSPHPPVAMPLKPETRACSSRHLVSHPANDCRSLGIEGLESVVFVEIEIRPDALAGFGKIPLHRNERTGASVGETEHRRQEPVGHDRAADCRSIVARSGRPGPDRRGVVTANSSSEIVSRKTFQDTNARPQSGSGCLT